MVVPLLSEPFFDSEACSDELTFAKNHKKPLVPVVGESYSSCPIDCRMILQNLNAVPCDEGSFDCDFENHFAVLLDKLIALLKSCPDVGAYPKAHGPMPSTGSVLLTWPDDGKLTSDKVVNLRGCCNGHCTLS